MCGAPKTQDTVQRTELDPALQRQLYGGTLADPRGGFGNSGNSGGIGSMASGGGGGGSDRGDRNNGFSNDVTSRTPEQQQRALDNQRRVKDALGMDTGPSAASRSNVATGSGGLYATGGPVSPQQGIASLNQGQMPMMGGQMPNLSDPMTAATLAMALRSPQMQYGAIAAPMQTNFNVGGYVEGPGTGTSDSIDSVILQNGQPVQQAKLSDGEFVMTENAVRGAGNGDREAGAARMYELMRQFERGGRV